LDIRNQYRHKKVLITGHTGFKGGWLTQWLVMMGAKVYGYALDPPTSPALFDQLALRDEIGHNIGDIRDFGAFKAYLDEVEPDIVFHMAAQSLVRASYERPVETVEVNTLGTAYVLDAIRQSGRPLVVIVVTSDKCYSNHEWVLAYREADRMGGYDVYSSSKGSAELLTDSWRSSFFHPEKLDGHGVMLSSVRAGNVIGGGDWAKDRIVPDCVRALSKREAIPVRSPQAIRPWQHVLEPLSGYLRLGAMLMDATRPLSEKAGYCSGFNFGPLLSSNQSVRKLTEKAITYWGSGSWKDFSDPEALHEAQLLQLSIEKAYHMLNWLPCWNFDETVRRTVEWYFEVMVHAADPKEITMAQIAEYETDSAATGPGV
jgi:CDP-glucose 4,6-dehydratase